MKSNSDPVIITSKLPAKHAIIWLHGLGADGHDFAPIVPELKLPEELAIKFIFPHAPSQPVTMNGGMVMPAWFDIYGLDLLARQDEAGLRQAEKNLLTLIEAEIAGGIAGKNIMLAGFSQGGALALHTALRFSQPLGGLLGLSTLLPLADKIEHEASVANKRLPVLLAHGELDPVISYNLGLMTKERLESLGYPVTWHEYAMAHTVCHEEIQDIRKFILQEWNL